MRKRETTHVEKNRTIKPRKDQNVRRKENLQILGNIESRHHQINGNQGKIHIEYLRRTRKLQKTKLYGGNLLKDKHLGYHQCEIFSTILELDEEGT